MVPGSVCGVLYYSLAKPVIIYALHFLKKPGFCVSATKYGNEGGFLSTHIVVRGQ